MLILKMGTLMNMGYEKTILLYNPSTYETADIISSYIYRVGLLEQDWNAILQQSVCSTHLLTWACFLSANKLSKRFSETSLW